MGRDEDDAILQQAQFGIPSGDYRPFDFTEHLAQWMLRNGFSTGHGESFVGLLDELEWQVAELREKARGAS